MSDTLRRSGHAAVISGCQVAIHLTGKFFVLVGPKIPFFLFWKRVFPAFPKKGKKSIAFFGCIGNENFLLCCVYIVFNDILAG